ncbi:MAG: prephenate dehydrogenase/arogenate dehydrogenase family protein [Candidatus Tectomicrobia bacterium]
MRLGFLGPSGTYTEEAAKAVVADAVYHPYPSINAVFEAVLQRQVERGLVPIENVIQGPVTETLDNLYHYAATINIIDMLVLPIEHAIGALSPASHITRVLSKDQALKQCSDYLQTHFPHAQQIEVASTSAAMEMIGTEQLHDAAAIGSAEALQQYHLHLLDCNIGNVKTNKTRFAVLGLASEGYHPRTGKDATALVIYPRGDRMGFLEDILSVVSRTYSLSLSSIHSRPDTLGAFRFYMEVEGHLDDAPVASCLAALEKQLSDDEVEIKIFGTYPRCPFNEPCLHTIGVIGGTGQMGQWFERFFSAAGYTVLISGRRTALTYERCIAQSDVVIINVPIKNTLEVIAAVGRFFRPGQLITDNTSIKTQPVAAMLAAVPSGVEVLGMHTVFGPAVESLRHQNVVFTRTPASAERASEFENIFYKYGAKITYTDPEHHDKQMAFHQNLEHFTKLVLAQVLRAQFGDPFEMDSYSSPNSRTSLITMGRILNADPDLYSEIQSHNLQGPAMIQTYLEAAQALGQALMAGDIDVFKEKMAASATALGPAYLAEMLSKSKALQSRLV